MATMNIFSHDLKDRMLTWLLQGDTGCSSMTILAVALELEPRHQFEPADSADFGRCRELLRQCPELTVYLPEVASRYPRWLGIVARWKDLTGLYDNGRFADVTTMIREVRNWRGF